MRLARGGAAARVQVYGAGWAGGAWRSYHCGVNKVADVDPSELAEVELALLARAPETVVAPSIERMSSLVSAMGDPQRCAPVIQIAGTNGKTSTARIVESILRAFGLRTGLYTSPHLLHMAERIQIDGEPISMERFIAAYREVSPFVELLEASPPTTTTSTRALSMFEVLTGMAFAAFADAPVDVMIIECGMGGSWDATNVVGAAVSVITPVDVDHEKYLGDTIGQIAAEKAGILVGGRPAVIAHQGDEAAPVVIEACRALGINPAREGIEFGLAERALAVGGQQLSIDGLGGRYDELFLPLHGTHQASNAAVAVAAVEAFLGGGTRRINDESVRAGLAAVRSPGRLELIRSGPAVIVDAAHNPHGAHALGAALSEAFDFGRVIGIAAVAADKDIAGILGAVEPAIDELIVTANSSARSTSPEDLGAVARTTFGDERVTVCATVASAVDAALERADRGIELGTVGIVAFGSVATVADVRAYLGAASPYRMPRS